MPSRRVAPTPTGSRGGRSRRVPSGTSASRRSCSAPLSSRRAWCGARVTAAASRPPPTGWLLLVDEGPGETWLYLAEERTPGEALAGFIGRRGRTDFARARRRSRLGGLASAGIFAGGEILGTVLAAMSIVTLIRARPR